MSYIVKQLKEYFDIRELVCKHVYDKYGERAWMFMDEKLAETLLVLRTEILNRPMTCNNWHVGGRFSQRGCRCNRCDLVSSKSTPYMSAHVLFRGGDFDVRGMTADQARRTIIDHEDTLPHPIRMEGGVNWLHIDTYDTGNGDKIYLFNP